MTWPLAAQMGSTLGAGLDPQLQTWILAWDAHALATNPLSIWQAPIFAPYPNTLAYTDHHLALMPVAAPLVWLSGSPALAYNVLVLLSYALSGWAVFLLARELTPLPLARSPQCGRAGVDLTAFVGGAAFAFCSFRMSQFVHLQMLQTAWLPLALLFLHRLLHPVQSGGGRWRDVVLLGLCVALQCVTALYFSYFIALAVGLFVALWAAAALWERVRYHRALPWKALLHLCVSGALALALIIPLTLPYLQVYQTLGIVRSARELENWSAPLQAYLAVDPGNALYGSIGGIFASSGGEFALFPGVVVSVLALLGVRRTAERQNRRTRRPPTSNRRPPTTDDETEEPQNRRAAELNSEQKDQPIEAKQQAVEDKSQISALGDLPSAMSQKQNVYHSSFIVHRFTTIFLLLLALIAFILSLGTGLRLTRGGDLLPISLPYGLLYERLPGFGALRVPARWGMLVALALCLLAVRGLTHLMILTPPLRGSPSPGHGRGGWGVRAIPLLALALILAESFTRLPMAPAPDLAAAPPIYRWMGAPEQRDLGVTLELPVGKTPRGTELDRTMLRQYLGMLHWNASPNGYSGLIPFGTTDLLGRVQSLPDEGALRFLQLAGVTTLVLHQREYPPDRLAPLIAGLEGSPLVQRRAEVGDALVYTLLPIPEADLPPGVSVLLTGDERAPGFPALGLLQRWQSQGATLIGPARVRYYGRLGTQAPGQITDYALLADAEGPTPYGFSADRRLWSAAGLAFYERDPALRASLSLGVVPQERFHPAYPEALELTVRPTQVQIADQTITLDTPVSQAYVRVEVVSLAGQNLTIGEQRAPAAPGLTRLTIPVTLGQPLRIEGRTGETAILRAQVYEGVAQLTATPDPMLALAAESAFDGSKLTITVQAGGTGALLVEARGASAYDDRPILLFEGVQPVSPTETSMGTFSVDLLKPSEPWLQQAGEPEDGRYIVYVKDANRPDSPGLPVAQFHIRGGRVTDPDPVPLPLTAVP